MIRTIKRPWFEVWGTEEAQNRFLKGLLVFLITLWCIEAIVLCVLALRKPPIIAVSATQSRILTVVPPDPELFESEVKRAVSGYLSARANWESSEIEKSLEKASRFVHPDFAKKYLAAIQREIREATEKKLSQRFYIRELMLDTKSKAARASGDRIIQVEGLRAATSLAIEVQYDFGPRTEINPEGIYITGERFISDENGDRR